ncbi:MAG: hypothetical protein KC583_24770 [Myxococcales bacterium]|nr:hypothetical protein [Myxococcales bacterium]
MKYVTFTLALVAMAFASIASAQEVSRHDQIHIAVQEICPVSGQKLGAHGAPLKVKIGEEHLFVCCQGCLQGKSVNPQHWATIHANLARAQRICPIMKKTLPENPKWTVVEGQIVYVCCPPCTEKIAAEPQKFLQEIDNLYLASLQARQTARRSETTSR